MRKFFFEKGEQIAIGALSFILAHNKIDSQSYMLERIQQSKSNYIYDYYTSLKHKNFIRYITCWEQVEKVQVKKQIKEDQKRQPRDKNYRKTPLSSFLAKKKNYQQENSLQNAQSFRNSVKSKELENTKNEIQDVRVLYVQLQQFSPITVPQEINQIKELFGIVYLMAKQINQQTGFWPQMVPVLDNRGQFRFIKKGKDEAAQIINLFQHLLQNTQKYKWSQKIGELYQRYQTCSSDAKQEYKQSLSKTIITEIKQKIIDIKYPIMIKNQCVYEPDFCKIVSPSQISITELDVDIFLEEFNLICRNKSDKLKEFVFDHRIFQPIHIQIQKQSSNFLIKYLQTFQGY